LWTAHPRLPIAWRPHWLRSRDWTDTEQSFTVLLEQGDDEATNVPELTTFNGQMIYVQDDDA
jgi:hypothetical protein